MFEFYTNMKILARTNDINFKSTPVHMVNVRNAKTGELIPAIFSKLNPYDYHDVKAIKKIEQDWANCWLIPDFCDRFFKGRDDSFCAIELISQKALAQKIIGLTSYSSDSFGLYKLMTKPALSDKNKETRKIKNIGEVLLGAIFNQFKIRESNIIGFSSFEDASGFYTKIFDKANISGIWMDSERCNDGHIRTRFTLTKEQYEKYIDYWQNEYKIKISA